MTSRSARTVAVRLEGGIGDHILGMRVLHWIRERLPDHEIVAYSDAAGAREQLEVARMSPHLARVVPVRQIAQPATREAMGALDNIEPDDLRAMTSADVFIDTYGQQFLASAAVRLDVPLFEMLARRPQLRVSPEAAEAADRLLAGHHGARFVGLNLSKYNPDLLRRHEPTLLRLVRGLLERPDVVILNLFVSSYEFSHWPAAERSQRQQTLLETAAYLRGFGAISDRLVPIVDLPLPQIAALLARCRYFIGLDNGIKHLAWALDVPHTLWHPTRPDSLHALRWMPDLNRILLFDCKEHALQRHMAAALAAVEERARAVAS
jgi:hypothetical protein